MNTNGDFVQPSTPAVDRDPASRPGVPMVPETPMAISAQPVARQSSAVEVLFSVDVGHLTPVFSTAVPPRGLSGVMRRRAYRMHEHHARRWLVLLLADRVDVWESQVRRHPLIFAGLAGAVVAGLVGASRWWAPRPRGWRRWLNA